MSKNIIVKLLIDLKRLFLEHPKNAGETYPEHLWFTITMAARFASLSFVIIMHGLFPFLFTTTASSQTENIYRIMKTRIPKKRREEIDREMARPIRINTNNDASRLAIIGGGFSGALVFANLVRQTVGKLTIDWFEPTAELGKGVAYGTNENVHLLNVRAELMGAFPHEIDHFYKWLQSEVGKKKVELLWNNHEITPETYVPRIIYAQYIQQIIADAEKEAREKDITVNIRHALVSDIALKNEDSQQLLISFEQNGAIKEIIVDAAALTIGNLPPRRHNFLNGLLAEHNNYVENIWNTPTEHIFPHKLHELSPNSEIVIIGTGLTTLDAVLSLKNHGYKGTIKAISRNGLIPCPHVKDPNKNPYLAWDWILFPQYAPKTALGLLVRIRKEVSKAQEQGYSWQSVVDSIRPVTQTLWKQLAVEEKRKFLKKLFTFWNIHRHRMALDISQEIKELKHNGTLEIIAGKIYYVGSEASGLTLSYRKRGSNRMETIKPVLVINCTGPEFDIAASDHNLLKKLRDGGLITVGPLRAGIEITEQKSAKGKASEALFPMGSMLVGELLETIAVPELRGQAQEIASNLLKRSQDLHNPDYKTNLSWGGEI